MFVCMCADEEFAKNIRSRVDKVTDNLTRLEEKFTQSMQALEHRWKQELDKMKQDVKKEVHSASSVRTLVLSKKTNKMYRIPYTYD